MSPDHCEGCGQRVSVAGGIANVWSFGSRHTSAMTLELADGTEHYLCFQCIDELDDDPTADDVAELPKGPREEGAASGADEDAGVGTLGPALVAGGLLGVAVGSTTSGPMEPWLATGVALGVIVGLLLGRLQGD